MCEVIVAENNFWVKTKKLSNFYEIFENFLTYN